MMTAEKKIVLNNRQRKELFVLLVKAIKK